MFSYQNQARRYVLKAFAKWRYQIDVSVWSTSSKWAPGRSQLHIRLTCVVNVATDIVRRQHGEDGFSLYLGRKSTVDEWRINKIWLGDHRESRRAIPDTLLRIRHRNYPRMTPDCSAFIAYLSVLYVLYACLFSNAHALCFFSARCNIYISRLCYDVRFVCLSAHLSVTEVHCGHGACREEGGHLALC